MKKNEKGFGRAQLACALVLGMCASALAQPSASTKKAAPASDSVAIYEIGVFGGGQFWKLRHEGNPLPNKLVDGSTFGARFTQDYWEHFGFEETWSMFGVNNARYPLTPGTSRTSYAFGARNGEVVVGPVVYLTNRASRFRPFLTAGPAFQYFWPTSKAKLIGKDDRYASLNAGRLTSSVGPAFVYGGGLKYYITHSFALRVDARGIIAENPHFGLSGQSIGPGSIVAKPGGTQLGIQLTAGISYRFGHEKAEIIQKGPDTKTCPDGSVVPVSQPCPPPAKRPINVTLSASESEVCPGVTVRVTPTTNLPPGATATYKWTINGEDTSSAPVLQFGTAGRTAGSYNVALTVSADGWDNGTGSTAVRVREYRAPSGSASAQPGELFVGDKATLSANFTGQCGGNIGAPRFSASEGTVSGNTYDSTGVQFDPNNNQEQRKTVTITATATDETGKSGDATTQVVVKKAAKLEAKRLPDLVFASNSARVNNCGKRLLLEELKTSLTQDPTGKVVFVGHTDKGEKATLDAQRALNAAAVISAGSGICGNFAPSQILISAAGSEQGSADFQPYFCGTSTSPKLGEKPGSEVSASDKRAQFRRVEIWFVPTGGVVPPSLKDPKDAASLNVSKLGCPK